MSQRWLLNGFEFRLPERLLYRQGRLVVAGPRALDVLATLVANADRVVSKSELLDQAWPGLVVEENNLAVQILALRRLLGVDAVVTIPRRGYRLAAQWSVQSPRPDLPTFGLEVAQAPVAAAEAPPSACAMVGLRAFDPVTAAMLAELTSDLMTSGGGAEWPRRVAGCVLLALPSVRSAVSFAFSTHEALARRGKSVAAAVVHGSPEQPGVTDEAGTLAAGAPAGGTVAPLQTVQELVDGLDARLESMDSFLTGGMAPSPRSDIYRLHEPMRAIPAGLTSDRHALLPTIAVVPLQQATRQGDALDVGDVVTDLVISVLSASPALRVISRLSTAAFRARNGPLSSLRTLLGADFVLSGSCALSGGRIVASVELADARTNTVLWARSFTDHVESVVRADSALVQSIADGAVQALVRLELRRFRATPLPDLATHTLLLGGIAMTYRLAPQDFARAKAALDEVAGRASGHASPWAWLARWHLFRIVQGWSSDRNADGRQALDHVHRALDIDPESSLALTMLGNVQTSYLRSPGDAEASYARALEINPNESLAWLQRGNAASFRGEGDCAVNYIEKAISLSPLDPAKHFYQSLLASAALSAGQFDRAIEAASCSRRLNRDHVSTHRVLAIALSLTGRSEEARESVRSILRLEPGLTVEQFIERSPGANAEQVRTFAMALKSAGLPHAASTH